MLLFSRCLGRPFYLFQFSVLSLALLLFAAAPSLNAQDTLSFGGVYDLPGAEVRATYTPVSPLAQRFTIEEVYRLPGTFYDPARLVALLPGVVQTNDQANHLSVRGNTPNANLWRINGLAIVNPNHTANAGTFYDFPTLSGGGVNAISAQMLDNSGFLAGNLPVEYGFATGGTFDLRLRPGSKSKPRHQAQAGFIGFDLSTEGPIGKAGKTSYLVNARYSFTGLLADMGVDFGGEEIRFADLNLHVHHAGENGDWSLFGVFGQSSNTFFAPDPSETELSEQKELFNIDFTSALAIFGASFNRALGKGNLSGGVALSGTVPERAQWLREGTSFNQQQFTNNLINARLDYKSRKELNPGLSLLWRVGSEAWRQDGEYDNLFRLPDAMDDIGLLRSPEISALSPYGEFGFAWGRNELLFGYRGDFFVGSQVQESLFSPRLRYTNTKGYRRYFLTMTSTNRPPLSERILLDQDASLEAFVPVTTQAEIGYETRLGGLSLKGTAFYQGTDEEYAYADGDFLVSANSLFELDPRIRFNTTAATRRYGVELEAGGGRKTQGWYYRGSLTLLQAQTEQADGEWTQDRYAANFISKVTLGREWAGQDKQGRPRVLGLNLALIAHGGERYGAVVAPIEDDIRAYFAGQSLAQGFINTTGTYFRPDLRLYKTKTRAKTTTTLALDLQNAAGARNLGNVYYDVFLGRPNERLQLGLIPVLSYRIVWR